MMVENLVESLEQMLVGSGEYVGDLSLPKRDFRKLVALTLCVANEKTELCCERYRPSAVNGCAFRGELETMKTCLSVGAV
jgi:hypothetical protein